MIRAKKALGQNFIRNKALARKIVAQLQISAGDSIIEIGPGEGVLTKIILEEYASCEISFFAIEKDRRLLPRLRDLSTESWYHVQQNDVLKVSFSDMCPGAKRVKVIGNIPYYITSDIVLKIVKSAPVVSQAVFTVQKEYAERLVAGEGSKAYSRLTVMVNTYCVVEKCFDISKSVFVPKPKVNSSVIRLVSRDMNGARGCVAKNREAYEDFVRCAFGARRKQFLKNIRPFYEEESRVRDAIGEFLSRQGYALTVRAEDITVEHYIALFNILRNRKD